MATDTNTKRWTNMYDVCVFIFATNSYSLTLWWFCHLALPASSFQIVLATFIYESKSTFIFALLIRVRYSARYIEHQFNAMCIYWDASSVMVTQRATQPKNFDLIPCRGKSCERTDKFNWGNIFRKVVQDKWWVLTSEKMLLQLLFDGPRQCVMDGTTKSTQARDGTKSKEKKYKEWSSQSCAAIQFWYVCALMLNKNTFYSLLVECEYAHRDLLQTENIALNKLHRHQFSIAQFTDIAWPSYLF